MANDTIGIQCIIAMIFMALSQQSETVEKVGTETEMTPIHIENENIRVWNPMSLYSVEECLLEEEPKGELLAKQKTKEPEEKTKDLEAKLYDACYTAPEKEFKINGRVFSNIREGCSRDYIERSRTVSKFTNDDVECMPGFTETQTFYNLITRSDYKNKYPYYWCSVRRVCCK